MSGLLSLRWISWKVFPPGFYTGEGDLPPSPPVFLGLVHFFLIFLKEGGETISESTRGGGGAPGPQVPRRGLEEMRGGAGRREGGRDEGIGRKRWFQPNIL